MTWLAGTRPALACGSHDCLEAPPVELYIQASYDLGLPTAIAQAVTGLSLLRRAAFYCSGMLSANLCISLVLRLADASNNELVL